jgi:hypothetical protein
MSLTIAMWSGPRNISTAMMRAFENRTDTSVWDEPLYACFLERTHLPHPVREEVLQAHAHELDYESVVARILEPPTMPIFYQKHMAHHLLPEMDRGWLDAPGITHAFLIRDPREMILSLVQRFPQMGLDDTGLPQQSEIFHRLLDRQETPPIVLDARDVLESPREMLSLLCDRFGVEFDDAMLSWPAGPRGSDGAWADAWYESVRASTGFAAWSPREGELPSHLNEVHNRCRDLYDEMHSHCLMIETKR